MPASQPQPTLKSMRIISGGLIGGVLLFLGVVVLVRDGIASSRNDLMAYIATGFTTVNMALASIMRSARMPSTTPDQDPKYWTKYARAHIVSMGLAEGSAFFCCVVLLISTVPWLFLVLLLPVGTMVAWFPREP